MFHRPLPLLSDPPSVIAALPPLGRRAPGRIRYLRDPAPHSTDISGRAPMPGIPDRRGGWEAPRAPNGCDRGSRAARSLLADAHVTMDPNELSGPNSAWGTVEAAMGIARAQTDTQSLGQNSPMTTRRISACPLELGTSTAAMPAIAVMVNAASRGSGLLTAACLRVKLPGSRIPEDTSRVYGRLPRGTSRNGTPTARRRHFGFAVLSASAPPW